jgi:hypothetical protein
LSAVATQPRATDPTAVLPEVRLFDPPGGEATLEDAILGAFDELERAGETGCPVCGGRITLAHGCEGCGSELF